MQMDFKAHKTEQKYNDYIFMLFMLSQIIDTQIKTIELFQIWDKNGVRLSSKHSTIYL